MGDEICLRKQILGDHVTAVNRDFQYTSIFRINLFCEQPSLNGEKKESTTSKVVNGGGVWGEWYLITRNPQENW